VRRDALLGCGYTMRLFANRDLNSRFVAIHENSLSNRVDPNDE